MGLLLSHSHLHGENNSPQHFTLTDIRTGLIILTLIFCKYLNKDANAKDFCNFFVIHFSD